jgi:hypothetical protein
MFKTGYILNRRADLVWFLGLPFVAVAAALAFQAWLPYVAVASINLWITIPHHYAGWVRSYGMPDVWARFKDRLIVGPIAIMGFTIAGLQFAPITLLLLVTAWDHQHSIMQQHGLARIYDFKAGAGLKQTRRYDLMLHCVLYGFMFINAPVFRFLWIRELHRMRIPLSVGFVNGLLTVTQVILVGYLIIYAYHVYTSYRKGAVINPIKYAFIFASYFLWYYVGWHTNSILLWAVAHRMMHGVQYIVMVYSFMQKSQEKGTFRAGFWSRLTGPGNLKWFLAGGVAYAVIFQLIINRPLDEFGFGVVNFAPYPAIPEFGIPALDYSSGYAMFSQMMIYSYGLMHYYLDSFIWKVTDKQTQKGL